MPAGEPAQQLLRGAAARSARDRRGDASSWTTTSHRRTASRVSYFYLTGTDTQPLSVTGQHPVGRSRLQVEPAQPQRRRHVDAEPDDHQPAPRHLHAAVRRPREQPDDVARRSELEVHDPGRPDAAAPDCLRVLHGPDVDRRPRCRQRLLRGEGQPEHEPRQPLLQVRRRGVVREDRSRHAARQLRRLRLQRQQDRQRLRRLPARASRRR